ncbi:MAG: hypothetical protein Q7T57_06665, partial [Dehalococcoidales bacterium]|nr:hypothetical protein [Dehalococcoidales bacterium]
GQSGLAYDVFSPERGYGVYVSLNPYTLMMSLIRINSVDEESHCTTGTFVVKIKTRKLGGVILWDRRLTVNEVKDAITGMDKLAMEHVGYINQETGERLKRPSS